MQRFARASATIAAAILASLTLAFAAAASAAADPATGTDGREFSSTQTRDFSVTDTWGSRPACLAAPQSGIFLANGALPTGTCR